MHSMEDIDKQIEELVWWANDAKSTFVSKKATCEKVFAFTTLACSISRLAVTVNEVAYYTNLYGK